MIFTSTPENGSSWQNSLIFGIDTEQSLPSDITLEILNDSTPLVRRRLYGVTSSEVDISPFLKHFSYTPPIISKNITITPSRSAKRIKLCANEVCSPLISLFHIPFDSTTPHPLSSTPLKRGIAPEEPVILSVYTPQILKLNITFETATSAKSTEYSAKTAGMPMDIIIPPTSFPKGTQSVHAEILGDRVNIATIDYTILPQHRTSWTLAWFNKQGGMETYTFPTSIRLSYEAQTTARSEASSECYTPLEKSVVRYRLCSAYETHEQMERIAEMIFSPRIFAIENGIFRCIAINRRTVEFDAHGLLRQMCIEVEQPWEGGGL